VRKVVERFDPEGWKRPEGEWRPPNHGSVEDRRVQRVQGVESGCVRPSKPDGAEELRIERVFEVFCAEANGQARNSDLAMVAKASLRASERPFRVSGSGRMEPLRMRWPH
jgi:hypothetical protein